MFFITCVRRASVSAVLAAAFLILVPPSVADAQRVSLTDLLNRIEALEDAAVEPGPGANLVGQNLTGVPLAGLDLRAVRAIGATGFGDLTGTNLSFADLRGANLNDATLCRTDFSDANLKNAVFRIIGPADIAACNPGSIAFVNEATICPDGLPAGSREGSACLNATPPSTTVIFELLSPVDYECFNFATNSSVDIRFGGFQMTTNPGSFFVVSQFPVNPSDNHVNMSGTLSGADFAVVGSRPSIGNFNTVFRLTGSFSDSNMWTGTFTIEFSGDLLGGCTNQSFEITGTRQ